MEKGTLFGFVLVAGGVFGGNILEGGDPVHLFTHPAPIMIVVVASIGATMLSFSFRDTVTSLKVAAKTLRPGATHDLDGTAGTLIELAGTARREGVLALETAVKTVPEPFMARALQLAVDGTDPDVIAEVLGTDIAARRARHKVGAKWFTTAGIFAPTFGIIGAVLGLIHTLGSMDDPASLGKGIAAAFIATFWGVFSANGVFLPVGNKLARLSEQEVVYYEMVVDGALAIQHGHPQSLVSEIVGSYLPAPKRPSGR